MSIPSLEDLRLRGAAAAACVAGPAEVERAVTTLRAMPPLVFAGECDDLKAQLADVAAGKAFLLQGGDCAETFDGVTAENVRAKLQVLLQMAVVLTYAASVPVVKVGRIAGQYAKPRSTDVETREGVSLPAYRGDAVNGYAFTDESRIPDPQRLVQVYNSSAATLNLCRAFLQGGYADLRQMHAWNTDFVADSPVGARLREPRRARSTARSTSCARSARSRSELHRVDFHSSHEALILEYEHALTRIDSRTGHPYDVSGHFLWIGERTRQLDGAHVELLSPRAQPDRRQARPDDHARRGRRARRQAQPGQRARPADVHHPARARHGCATLLPELVEKVTAAGVSVGWVCDPMHGNTFETSTGYKTRNFDDVIDEVQGFFEVHHALGTWPGGLHVELTGGRRHRVPRRR